MKFKKLTALILAAVLIGTLPVPVFADDAEQGYGEAAGEAESYADDAEIADEAVYDDVLSSGYKYEEEPGMLTEEDYNYDGSDILLEENAQAFTDIPSTHNYYTAIQWAAEQGITGGYKDGTFRSGNPCTRGQIIKFIWNYVGKPEPKSMKQRFNDVPKSHGYFKAIQWAAENNITGGYTDGSGNFGVNDPCTRGHIVTFIWRAVGKPQPNLQWEDTLGKIKLFPDVATNHSFYTAVMWAFSYNLTSGYVKGSKAGKFGLSDECTRGQAVTFFYRLDRGPKHSTKISITSESPVYLATGMTYKLKYSTSPSGNNDAFVLKSDNTKIATVKPDGTVKGIGKGSTQVHVFTSSGLHVYISVNVHENVSDNWNYSTNVSDYKYDVTVQPTKAYYSGSTLIVETLVVNNTMRNVIKFCPIEVTVSLGEDKPTQITKKKWDSFTLNLKPYTMVKKTFKFPNAKIVDLASDVVSFSYVSTYSYNYNS